jgi:ubiquinone/menaquinone biosynthesis C-methylase UbiE
MFNGDSTKINRYVGSFYNIKLQDESIDVAILSQAFHHAERPSDLLQEIHRILKRTGVVYIFGEHFIDWKKILWRFLSILLKKRKLIINFRELFPTDPVLGDHYYKISDYFKMAEAAGFSCTVDILPSGQALYTLYK